MSDSAKGERLNIEIPEQGILKRRMTPEQVVAWLKEEARLWSSIGIPEDFQSFNTRYQANLRHQYTNYIQPIINEIDKSGASPGLQQMIDHARAGQFLIMQGAIGERVQDLIARKQSDRAVLLAASFSELLYQGNDRGGIFGLLRAAIIDSPWSTGARDLHAVREIKRETEKASRSANRDALRLEEMVAETTERLSSLESLYHEKLLLEGPSKHWKAVQEVACTGKKVAFVAFCILLAVPAILAICYWDRISAYLDHLVSQAAGGVSLAGIAAISVPVLAYGWLLKHVSRSFVQNLAIETDARHRRVMATTFLGLAKRKAVDLKEADRALILNALFRPAPPYSNDDGPPVGLLDLIKR